MSALPADSWSTGGSLKSEEVKRLAEAALEVRKNAYCPYSKFPVGAALLCADGTIVKGCNVENASYGLTICAERNAVARAVADGHRSFRAVAVAAEMRGQYVPPCGACRQVLAEFDDGHEDGAGRDVAGAASMAVFLVRASRRTVVRTTVAELLPMSFSPSWVVFDGRDGASVPDADGLSSSNKKTKLQEIEMKLDELNG